jgi:hypothetical protein
MLSLNESGQRAMLFERFAYAAALSKLDSELINVIHGAVLPLHHEGHRYLYMRVTATGDSIRPRCGVTCCYRYFLPSIPCTIKD